MHARILVSATLIGLLATIGCDPTEEGTGWPTDPREASDPLGSQPLLNMDTTEVNAAVFGAWGQIADGQTLGMKIFADELKKELKAKGLDTKVADNLNEGMIDEAMYDLPSALTSGGTTTKSGDVATRDLALTPDYAKYFKCPILAPGSSVGTTCEKLVKGVVAKAAAALKTSQQKAVAEVQKLHKDLSSEAQKFIQAWAQAAIAHGSSVAAVYAEHQLSAAAQCDSTKDKMEVSYKLGVQQGHKIVMEMRAWARTQVSSCVVNTDAIAKKVESTSLTKIDAWMKAHAVCKEEDISTLGQVFQQAEIKRKEGIKVGITQQVKVLKSELFSLRATIPCGDTRCVPDGATKGGECRMTTRGVTANGYLKGWWIEKPGQYKVCCRKQRRSGKLRCVGTREPDNKRVWCAETSGGQCLSCQTKYIYIGSPVAVDLDGDGLSMARGKVTFDLLADGNPQRLSWVGPREALLALDLDGDGQVTDGTELFGSSTDCAGARCYDGVDALAQYDAPARGGNGDGFIDAQDAVFSRLLLWTDRDQDGRSDAGELAALAGSRVRSFSLNASYDVQRWTNASITARLQVMTDHGIGDAYDVWFHMDLAPANLKALMPR